MADRVNVAFSMSAEDLTFLASMMEFVKGGIEDHEEPLREFWRVKFDEALDEYFEPVEETPEDEGPRLHAFDPE